MGKLLLLIAIVVTLLRAVIETTPKVDKWLQLITVVCLLLAFAFLEQSHG